jgi:beta-lactamase regulating signal transducer with metallopeptidase domain
VWNAPLGSLRTLLPPDETLAGIDWLADSDANKFVASPADPLTVDRWGEFDLPATAIATIPLEQTPMASVSRWLAPSLVCVWAAGTALWIALSLRRIRRFKLLLRRARRAPAHLQEEVRILADQLGLKRVPEVRVARRRFSPLVWALFGRPTILLPAGLLRKLTRPQRTALLLHELAHLRRRDHWTKSVELAAITVYWWLPTAWLARRHADCAAEHCCDALVVSHSPTASRAYAEALLATIDFLSPTPTPLPLGASGFSQFGQVSRRIEMILEPQPEAPRSQRSRSWTSCLALLVVSLVVLPTSVRTLWAEPPTSLAETTPEPNEKSSATTKPQETGASTSEPTLADKVAPEKTDDGRHASQLESYKVESELYQIIRKTDMAISLVQTNMNRRDAAFRQVKAMQEAYEAGSVTLDQLLECQRRLAEARMAYARNVCGLDTEPDKRRLLLAQAALVASQEATNSARETWRKVYNLYRIGSPGGEAQQEALAREQFYMFKRQLELATAEYERVQDSQSHGNKKSSKRSQTRGTQTSGQPATIEGKLVVKVKGPVTSEGPVPELDPPSDDEVLRAAALATYWHVLSGQFRKKQSKAFGERKNLRIVKEKIAEYLDPPKYYPGIGEAQLHHVHYKCTLYSHEPDERPEWEVVYVDHNHFHRSEKTDAKATEGVTFTIPPGQQKVLTMTRHCQLQLAREKVKLEDLKKLLIQSVQAGLDYTPVSRGELDRRQLELDITKLEQRIELRANELEAAKGQAGGLLYVERLPNEIEAQTLEFMIGTKR